MPAADFDLYQVYQDFDADDAINSKNTTALPGGFSDFLEIYHSSGATQDDAEADEEMFYQFLNAFVPDTESHSADWWADIREDFYELSGITGEDIDWEAYREAIGYGSNT